MCIYDAISCDYDCYMNSTSASFPPVPILHADARSGEGINYQYPYTTGHAGSMSTDITSSLLFARQPAISATNEPFESLWDPVDIQQPPPHVIDYWFDQLGLSLDPTPSENSSNATSSSFQFPLFDSTTHSTSGTASFETSSFKNPLVPNAEPQEPSVLLPFPANQAKRRRTQPHGVACHHQPRIAHDRQKLIRKVYDQPGKKPEAEYERDPMKLETLCRLRGGMEFACQWIPRIFKDGVTLEALIRRLKLNEIESMNFQGGFEPYLAYDGFLQVAEGGFECCLCMVDKRIWWRNKKAAVRHFRKCHFGLADQCITCGKSIYSTGEMNSHRCAPPRTLATLATAVGPEASSDSPVDSPRN